MKRLAQWGRLAALAGLFVLIGCAGGRGLSDLEKADRAFGKGDYPGAIEGYRIYLEGGAAGLQSPAAQYRLGLAYFKNQDYPTAAVELEIYQRDYPRSDSLFAAAYYEALCWARQSPRYDRDSSLTEKAIRMLENYLLDHPGTHYNDQARTELEELKDKMARKHIEVARFYRTVKRAEAAEIYYSKVLEAYPQSRHREEAALGLLAMLLRQGKQSEAQLTYEAITAEFADSRTASRAKALIEGRQRP